MKGTTDMTGTEEGGSYTLLPEGTYVFNVAEVEDKTTKNEDPMMNVMFTVAVGEFAGKKVWDNIIIPEPGSPAEKIKGRTMHFLHCINEPYEGKFEWNSDMWVGKAVSMRIFHEEYNGKTRAKVAEYIFDEDNQEIDDASKVPF